MRYYPQTFGLSTLQLHITILVMKALHSANFYSINYNAGMLTTTIKLPFCAADGIVKLP